MTQEELEALPVLTGFDGVLWREDGDPHDVIDFTGTRWEIGRLGKVIVKRVAISQEPHSPRAART